MAGVITKLVLMWICINVMLALFGFTIAGDQGNTVTKFFGNGSMTGLSGDISTQSNLQLETGSASGTTAIFTDPIKTVFGFFGFLRDSMGGAFFGLLIALGLPSAFVYLLAIPMTAVLLLALVGWIRGVDP